MDVETRLKLIEKSLDCILELLKPMPKRKIGPYFIDGFIEQLEHEDDLRQREKIRIELDVVMELLGYK